MIQLVLEAPWQTFHKEVMALFAGDPDIEVGDIYEDDKTDYAFDITVRKHDKYMAMARLIPGVKTFGNVSLGIVMYDLENEECNGASAFQTLFRGNKCFDSVQTREDPTGCAWDYVLFAPEVVQFFDDDMTDYNGNWTGLMEDIARDVFEGNDRGVFFCTASKG